MPGKPPSDTDAGKGQMTILRAHAKHSPRRQVEISPPGSLFPLGTVLLQDRHFQAHQTPVIQLPPPPLSSTGETSMEKCVTPILCSVSGSMPSPPLASRFLSRFISQVNKTNDAILGATFRCPPCRCSSLLCDGQRPPPSHAPTALPSAPGPSSAGSDGPEEEGHNK